MSTKVTLRNVAAVTAVTHPEFSMQHLESSVHAESTSHTYDTDDTDNADYYGMTGWNIGNCMSTQQAIKIAM